MARGLVIDLTQSQILNRMRYLAGEIPLEELDDYIDKDTSRLRKLGGYDEASPGTPTYCPDIFYLLKDHNGGKDPTAPDCATRWSKAGASFVNRTSDCIGGMAWAGGFDRYQPERFSHIYDGWINTNSMIMDARSSSPRCFASLDRPEPGCFVVCGSGSPGHDVGHIGGVVSVPAEWDPSARECWDAVAVVDVASVGARRANTRRTARGWFGTGALFTVSTMRSIMP
jgi:hypothetical protein